MIVAHLRAVIAPVDHQFQVRHVSGRIADVHRIAVPVDFREPRDIQSGRVAQQITVGEVEVRIAVHHQRMLRQRRDLRNLHQPVRPAHAADIGVVAPGVIVEVEHRQGRVRRSRIEVDFRIEPSAAIPQLLVGAAADIGADLVVPARRPFPERVAVAAMRQIVAAVARVKQRPGHD